MLDLLGAFEDMPGWDEIADQLFNACQTLNPSELHGVLVGLMGAGFNPDDKHHLEQTLASAEKAVGFAADARFTYFMTTLLNVYKCILKKKNTDACT